MGKRTDLSPSLVAKFVETWETSVEKDDVYATWMQIPEMRGKGENYCKNHVATLRNIVKKEWGLPLKSFPRGKKKDDRTILRFAAVDMLAKVRGVSSKQIEKEARAKAM